MDKDSDAIDAFAREISLTAKIHGEMRIVDANFDSSSERKKEREGFCVILL